MQYFRNRSFRRAAPSGIRLREVGIFIWVAVIFLSGCSRESSSPSGPAADARSVETLATPVAFAEFTLTSVASGLPLHIEGVMTLSAGGHDLDPGKERVVISLGSELTVIEPGQFSCTPQKACQYSDSTRPVLQAVSLNHLGGGKWSYLLTGAAPPAGWESLYMRVGNDWGGWNSTLNRPVLALAPELDTDFAVSVTVGSGGGQVQTTDASGARILLSIPAGALAADTVIRMTPIKTSPLAKQAAEELIPGIHFEPAGLRFAVPATLTMDFTATALTVKPDARLFLITSPLSVFPVTSRAFEARKTIVASIDHFSDYGVGHAMPAFADLAAWADPILQSGGQVDISTLELLDSLYQEQSYYGCSVNCQDGVALRNSIVASINFLVQQACPADLASPSFDALRHWVLLSEAAMRFNVSTPQVEACATRVLHILIERAATQGLAHPEVDQHFEDLVYLYEQAQLQNMDGEQAFALGKLTQVLDAIVAYCKSAVRNTPTDILMGRLKHYYDKAGQLGLNAQQRNALTAFAEGLAKLLADGDSACTARNLSGLNLLASAKRWSAELPVDTVDPGLTGRIETAYDSCRASMSLTGTILPRSLVQTSCAVDVGEGADCGAQSVEVATDIAVPASLNSEAFSYEVKTLSPFEMAVEANVTKPRGKLGFLLLGLNFPGPGTLQADVNSGWQTSPVPGLNGQTFCPMVSVHTTPEAMAEWGVTGRDALVIVDLAAGQNLCIGGRGDVFPFWNLAGSGRMVTLRFNPAP